MEFSYHSPTYKHLQALTTRSNERLRLSDWSERKAKPKITKKKKTKIDHIVTRLYGMYSA